MLLKIQSVVWPNSPVIPTRSEESVQQQGNDKTLYNAAGTSLPYAAPVGLYQYVCPIPKAMLCLSRQYCGRLNYAGPLGLK